MSKTKPYIIPKQLVMQAYQLVKANKGSAGGDQQSLEDFDKDLKDNLYKIWNRMSSGTYFPPAVKAVPIPKKSGGERILGIPTVSDRIAQMVVKLTFEPLVEPCFLSDSYGYRPNKSAIDAVGVTRQRCWEYDWVLEFDIKGLFDNIDHELLMKAVRKHTDIKWVILYIERWLKAPMQMADGALIQRTKGTPQGGLVSPVLSNLFLHYVFDVWMGKHHHGKPWCRYADDGLVHCKTEQEAQQLFVSLKQRFEMCGLELHPEKTKIIYCKDGKRKTQYPTTQFTFLGYDFRARASCNSKTNEVFQGFSPAVSKSAQISMRSHIRASGIRNRSDLSLQAIANMYNPILRGWINYYGCYQRSALESVMLCFNKVLKAWAMRKYKKLRGRKTMASLFILKIQKENPQLFSHWSHGLGLGFA
ncbi:MAG: group II intron reverse transcriptase/maturase [Betaproteobacteria bacterium]